MNVLKVYRIVKEKLCVSILMVVTTVVVQLDTQEMEYRVAMGVLVRL